MKMNSNFFAENIEDGKKCTGCSICEKKCPVDAIKMQDVKADADNVDKETKDNKDSKKAENKSYVKNKKIAVIDKEWCIGCGVCTRFCPSKCLNMERRDKITFVP